MADTQEKHDPSRYRALVREMKSGLGKHPGKLLDGARCLGDPYFASLALFDLSADPRLKLKEAVSAAGEALVIAGRVERPWRRAELLAIIAKKVGSWRDEEASQYRERLWDEILDAVVSMPDGKGLSDAIGGCAPRLGCGRLGPLLAKAVSNQGSETTDAKAVIRQWAQLCKGTGPTPEDVLGILAAVDDGAVRSKVMGYLHLQCIRSRRSCDSLSPLQGAVEAAVTVGKEERLDALRYLAGQSFTKEELEIVAGALYRLDDPASRVRLMATLGGSADKAGLKEMALDWFREGLQMSSQVEDPYHRAIARLNLARGLGRCGEAKLARQTYLMALDDCGDNEKLVTRIHRSMEDQGLESSAGHTSREPERRETSKAPGATQAGGANNILALYNTYEGGLKPVHLRAAARAAPLCAAFGLDLALMGFPTDALEGLVSQIITDTSVGRGGRYLRELVEQGRVVLVSRTKREALKDWGALGLPVATTSHPKEDKRVRMSEAMQLARSKHPLGRVCLIMGLGKRGLPPSLLDMVPYHLELTGSDVPLETCTAMGVIAQQLRSENK